MDRKAEKARRSSPTFAETVNRPGRAVTRHYNEEAFSTTKDKPIPLDVLNDIEPRNPFYDDEEPDPFQSPSPSRSSSLRSAADREVAQEAESTDAPFHYLHRIDESYFRAKAATSSVSGEGTGAHEAGPPGSTPHQPFSLPPSIMEENVGHDGIKKVRASSSASIREHFPGEPTVSRNESLYDVSIRSGLAGKDGQTGSSSSHRQLPQLSRLETRSSRWDEAGNSVQGRSAAGSSSAVDILGRSDPVVRHRYFASRRVRQEDIQRPWLKKRDPREKWLTIIPCVGILIGVCIAALLVWDGMRTVINHSYCQVLDDDFTNGLDLSVWMKEAEVGGFGNGQFEQTTIGDENVYVDAGDGSLTIRPTLQNATLVTENSIINLTKAGICSSNVWSDCVATTNTTNGTIVNPVKSARISTRNGPRIKYGRVEVTATLPIGDWLWPAIWMLPVNATYGPWPQSGEIDIMEARGNNYTYPMGGNNIMSSTLHWGPSPATDAWWRSTSERTALHSTYAEGPHVYGMEWSESYIFTYVDNRLLQVLYFNFLGDLWAQGDFPPADPNGTRFVDPWSQTGRTSTPFDEDFYLIINLAVGATNGWFEDGLEGKPWVDASKTARRDFWEAQAEWYPTWVEGGVFKIHRVQMWQQQGYNGCMED